MTYELLYKKWANRLLYENDGRFQSGGRIFVFRENNYKLPHLPNEKIIADVWHLPTIHGWAGEKQRAEFYRDAKLAKLSRRKDKKFEFYKIIGFN